MFAFFEKLIDPFPTAEPVKPPATLLAFTIYSDAGSAS